MTRERLTHVGDSGRARMVDISGKPATHRSAAARGRVSCSARTIELISGDRIAKGSVLDTARIAGVMAAKRTPELIPLCHPLPLRHVDVDLRVEQSPPGVVIEATAKVDAATGVEMEALTAVAVAGLTVIDMIKAVDRWASLTDIELIRKEGGASGTRERPGPGDQPGEP